MLEHSNKAAATKLGVCPSSNGPHDELTFNHSGFLVVMHHSEMSAPY
jgi:hypothetical protein